MSKVAQEPEGSQRPEQLELFESRLPRRPYCTDDLEQGLRIRDPRRAVRAKYIQAQPPWLRAWLIFDCDYAGAALSWEDAHLPPPAWTAMSRSSGHAHLSWGLDAPVLLGHHDRQRPMRYLAAVESAMRTALEADAGYSGLITKNPAHPEWRVLWGRHLYELAELQDWLELPKHVPRKRPERVGVGRNVDTFDHLRYFAYRSKRWWLREHGRGSYIYWQAWLYRQALDYTHAEHPIPLDSREVHWIARSVAHWVWTRFNPDESDQRFSALQSARGRKGGSRSGEARRRGSEAEQRPWEALGIHRATYYRRKKRGELWACDSKP